MTRGGFSGIYEGVSTPPLIFDRALLRRRLARAARAPCDFLAQRVAEDVVDRLSGVSRAFPRVLDYGSPHPAAADALAAPGRTILRAAPSLETASGADLVIDEEFAPFSPEQFDLVVSALALQWVNDLPGVFAQLRRLLAPDGLLLAALVGGQSLGVAALPRAGAGGDRGRRQPARVPVRRSARPRALLQRAGFALPVTDCDAITIRYDNMFALLRDLRGMGATNILAAGARRPLKRAVLLRAAELYQENFADADGRIRASMEILWLSGWAPHESQQKPLRPGSAQVPLSSALGDKSKP